MIGAGAQRILELLDFNVPPPRRGTRLLDQALEQAGLVHLPESTPELRAFVRRSLRPVLAKELGPGLADEVTGGLEAALSPALRGSATQPAAPSSMRMTKVSPPSAPAPSELPPASSRIPTSVRGLGQKVLLLGRDRFGAASLARSLVGSGFKITTAFEVDELVAAMAEEHFDAVLCDELSAHVHLAVLRRAVQEHHAALVVSGCLDSNELEAQLREAGIANVFGMPSGFTTRDIVATLARSLV